MLLYGVRSPLGAIVRPLLVQPPNSVVVDPTPPQSPQNVFPVLVAAATPAPSPTKPAIIIPATPSPAVMVAAFPTSPTQPTQPLPYCGDICPGQNLLCAGSAGPCNCNGQQCQPGSSSSNTTTSTGSGATSSGSGSMSSGTLFTDATGTTCLQSLVMRSGLCPAPHNAYTTDPQGTTCLFTDLIGSYCPKSTVTDPAGASCLMSQVSGGLCPQTILAQTANAAAASATVTPMTTDVSTSSGSDGSGASSAPMPGLTMTCPDGSVIPVGGACPLPIIDTSMPLWQKLAIGAGILAVIVGGSIAYKHAHAR